MKVIKDGRGQGVDLAQHFQGQGTDLPLGGLVATDGEK